MDNIPVVIDPNNARHLDIYSRLLQGRQVFVNGQITDDMANIVIAQLMHLAGESPTDDIHMYINSPGGSVSAGLGIYDVMQFVKPQIHTVCVGMAASMGSILLMGGEKGKRFCLPNSRVLIHQPLINGVLNGTASDLDIQAQEILRLRRRLYEIIATHTGQPMTQVELDADRDKWFDATQAVAYGAVDGILQRA